MSFIAYDYILCMYIRNTLYIYIYIPLRPINSKLCSLILLQAYDPFNYKQVCHNTK